MDRNFLYIPLEVIEKILSIVILGRFFLNINPYGKASKEATRAS